MSFIPSDIFTALTALCSAQPSLWFGTKIGCVTRGSSVACSTVDT